ncbi:MAG: DUF3305 domain-containing protein [Geminicoccaceae bacterium]|nr:DUF3305 domain-containing protein [Geminicoccaceae bacterium]MCX8101573.1 DUF3305 domain-containing protein [Geminicoccaceae bacterium]MDW8369116.1 DUF3305 domain-containing protein [Geminicoccaceae bacterium]
MSERRAVLELGVVVEKRRATTRWADWLWRPIAVVPGIGSTGDWRLLVEGEGWSRWLAGTLPLELHHKETADYRLALSATPPQLYVVLRRNEAEPDRPWRPFLLTASPFEAQIYAEPGEDLVEAVPMPEPVIAFVQDFVDRHHRDEPFLKRRRKAADAPPDAASAFEVLGPDGGRS